MYNILERKRLLPIPFYENRLHRYRQHGDDPFCRVVAGDETRIIISRQSGNKTAINAIKGSIRLHQNRENSSQLLTRVDKWRPPFVRDEKCVVLVGFMERGTTNYSRRAIENRRRGKLSPGVLTPQPRPERIFKIYVGNFLTAHG